MRGVVTLLLLLWPLSVLAQEYQISDGPMPDDDFYRMVACGAPLNGPCESPFVRWAQPRVRVAFEPIPLSYPRALADEMSRVLDLSISQINGTAPGIRLQRVAKSQPAEIRLFLSPIREGDVIRGTGVPDVDGIPIGAAMVYVWWDGQRRIEDAVIVFASDIPLSQAGPIMLEELTQSLGLMTDIRNPYYESRSVFSEDSNAVQKLGAQDRMALRRHYP